MIKMNPYNHHYKRFRVLYGSWLLYLFVVIQFRWLKLILLNLYVNHLESNWNQKGVFRVEHYIMMKDAYKETEEGKKKWDKKVRDIADKIKDWMTS